jgi:hypothetical protein
MTTALSTTGATTSVALKTYDKLMAQLNGLGPFHKLMEGYYEGLKDVPKLNISMPPVLQHLETVVGWPGTAIDVLEERVEFQGWDDEDKYGLMETYEDNQLASELSMNHTDSFLMGQGFVHISAGAKGEPDVLVTVETPQNLTGVWDQRKRRLSVAAQRIFDEEGKFTRGALYEEDRTVYYRRTSETSRWAIEHVDTHRLGRVPIVRFANRGRAGRREGRSEITRAVRAYTDMAVRTLLGMEVNREFFSAPQRYVLGAKENAFVDEAGQPIPGWKAIMGSVWGLERDEDWVEEHGGEGMPVVGEFKPAPPGPYLEQIRGLGQLFSAEVGIPPTYLGFASEQAPSADAIRALEARLVKRAERRQLAWASGYVEVGQLIAQIKKRTLPPRSDIQTLWGDPAIPTRSADADRAVKLVGAGIVPPDSGVTREMVGLSPAQQKRLERDKNKQAFMDVLRGGVNAGGDANGAGQGQGTNARQPVAGSNDEG